MDHDQQDPQDDAWRELLDRYAAQFHLPVQWGEQDANGHVNHASPVRWLESARMNYIRENGIYELLREANLAPLLAELRCGYRRQLTFPDKVHIGTRVSDLGRSSMTIQQGVFSEQQETLAIEAEVKVVIFDTNAQRPRRIPQAMRDVIERETT